MKNLNFDRTVTYLKEIMQRLSNGESIDIMKIVSSMSKKFSEIYSVKMGPLADKSGMGAILEFMEHKFFFAVNKKYGAIDHYVKAEPNKWKLDLTMYFDNGSINRKPNFVVSQNRHGGVWSQSRRDVTPTFLKDIDGEYVRTYKEGALAHRFIRTPLGNERLGI